MGYRTAVLARSRGGYAYRRARGGFLSSIGRAISSVGRVASAIPGLGIVGTVAGAVGSAMGGSRTPTLTLAGGTMPGGVPLASGYRPEPGITGAVHRLVPGGSSGYVRAKRINVANAKAGRRAIRRIKGLRNLLKSIERELPRRPAARGSRGVITRSEAARALRS